MALYCGDCFEVMRGMADNSVDMVLTDPPAGIGFMGREWDKDKGGRDNWIVWMAEIAAECLRLIKPGGHALVWALPRTSHWTGMAWENGGWQPRDKIAHVFGSGFPKSLDVSKAIDKAAGAEREVTGKGVGRTGSSAQPNGGSLLSDDNYQWPGEFNITTPATDAAREWDGWGTALKPGYEEWWLLRKPLIGTVAANVLEYGTGALNIDACRVGTADNLNGGAYSDVRKPSNSEWVKNGGTIHNSTGHSYAQPSGRWPANLIHDGSEEVTALFPMTKPSKANKESDERSVSFYQAGDCKTGGFSGRRDPSNSHSDAGGSAARFFYCAKSSKRERGESNTHPTVKPIALMEYLVQLASRPGAVVLDPFMGSGTTGIACRNLGRDFIGIERDPDYFKIAESRIGTTSRDQLYSEDFF